MNPTSLNDIRALLRRIQQLASGIPSRSELDETMRALMALEEYLRAVRLRIEQIQPLADDTVLRDSLAAFDQLLAQAENSPVLSLALGVKPKKQTRKPPPPSHTSPEASEKLLSSLMELSVDQVRERLQSDSSISLRDLRGLAALLAIRTSSRVKRETLANQIAMGIANVRGYRHLSGDDLDDVEPRDHGPSRG